MTTTWTRRRILAEASVFASTFALAGCAASDRTYDAAVEQTWRPFDGRPTTERDAVRRELVRVATLAPSSHNTQCWRFELEPKRISIAPDFSRRCPAVDPDDHHLFVSLGCAAENMTIAGLAMGLRGNVRLDRSGGDKVRIDFEAAKRATSPLLDAIPRRQCTRAEYDGVPLLTSQLRELERAGTGNGVHILLLTTRSRMDDIANFVVRGNTAQMNDRAFMAELRQWIRFSDDEAVEKRDGLFSRASGNPSVPRWIAAPLLDLLFTAKTENERYTKFIRSSSGIAVFVSEKADPEHWVEAGRCYERFVLQATTMGIRTAMVNQPVEVVALRSQFATSLGIAGRRPDLVARFGHAPEMPRSLRRPIDAVIA